MEKRSLSYVRVYLAFAAMAVIAAIIGPLTWTQILIITACWALLDGAKELWLRFTKRISLGL